MEEGWYSTASLVLSLFDGPYFLYFLGILGLVLSYLFGLIVAATENYSSSKMEELIEDLPDDERLKAKRYDERWRDILYAAIFCRTVSNLLVFAPLLKAEPRFSSGAFLPALGIVVVLFLVGYSFPKAVARRGEEVIFLRFAPSVHLLSILLYPVLLLGRASDRLVGKLTGKLTSGADTLTEEEILDLVSDGELEGIIEEEEAEMIGNIFRFDDLPVSEVMTPVAEMTAVNADARLGEAVKLAIEAGHSRIPVYSGERREIVGVLYVKDLLNYWHDPSANERKVREVARGAYFVPETKKISELFKEFKEKHIHFAIVLDEYGGTRGIVTIEDIIEEIVGEIEDEYDIRKADEMIRLPDGTWVLDARITIEELNRKLRVELPLSERYDTVAGLILDSLGRIPEKGEYVTGDGWKLTVMESDEKAIKKVTLFVGRPAEDGGDGNREN